MDIRSCRRLLQDRGTCHDATCATITATTALVALIQQSCRVSRDSCVHDRADRDVRVPADTCERTAEATQLGTDTEESTTCSEGVRVGTRYQRRAGSSAHARRTESIQGSKQETVNAFQDAYRTTGNRASHRPSRRLTSLRTSLQGRSSDPGGAEGDRRGTGPSPSSLHTPLQGHLQKQFGHPLHPEPAFPLGRQRRGSRRTSCTRRHRRPDGVRAQSNRRANVSPDSGISPTQAKMRPAERPLVSPISGLPV